MQSMRAPVKPRFLSSSTGAALVLEDSVLEAFQHFERGVIEISGPDGGGKSFALRHLAMVLPTDLGIVFRERHDKDRDLPDDVRVILEVAPDSSPSMRRIGRFDLAPWGSDECIEYALARYPGACQSALRRLLDCSDRRLLNGRPELCVLVVDRMVANDSLTTVADTLLAELTTLTANNNAILPSPDQLLIRHSHLDWDQERNSAIGSLGRLLRHASIRSMALAKQIADELNQDTFHAISRANEHWNGVASPQLVRLVLQLLSPDGTNNIRQALRRHDERQMHPLLASMMHQLDPVWRPHIGVRPDLMRADLRFANWPQADLRHFDLRGVYLNGACLDRSLLIGADQRGADLSNSSLMHSILRNARADAANFSDSNLLGASARYGQFHCTTFRRSNIAKARFDDANLTGANLTDASLRNSTLISADLRHATLNGTDLTNADLTAAKMVGVSLSDAILDGAVFERTDLSESNLEGLQLASARFSGARLTGAILTGSSMPNADFRGCQIMGAYLADVAWPDADLRMAQLTGSTFHMGSSRSGLVDSHIASEGTRTGFYSDDYDDHLYRPPEEIRAADLRGCDLRGANLKGVDFYRVDLRGAQFDEHHRQQFIATGALLD